MFYRLIEQITWFLKDAAVDIHDTNECVEQGIVTGLLDVQMRLWCVMWAL